MENKWYEVSVGSNYKYMIKDLPNKKGIIEVYKDPKQKFLSVETSFRILSKDSAAGVPHLLEHSIFSNVIDGKSLFEANDILTELGIDLNAWTDRDRITISTKTATIYSTEIGKDDKDYQEMLTRRSVDSYIKNITKIHKNMLATVIPEEYFNKEKEIVCSEIDTNYSGDALDIQKSMIPYYVYGGNFSSIGIKENVQKVTYNEIEELRLKTFNTRKLDCIKVTAPMDLDIEYIEHYVDKIYNTLMDNDIKEAEYEGSESSKIVNDAAHSGKYKPNVNSSQLLQVTSEIENKSEVVVHDLNLVPNQRVMMEALFTFPVCETTNIVDYLKNILTANIFLDSFIEFYREKYPFMYRYTLYWKIPFEFDGNYMSSSLGAAFKEDLTVEEFQRTYEEFKNEFLPNNINKYIETYINRAKGSWYGLVNESDYFYKAKSNVAILSLLDNIEPFAISAKEKAELLSSILKTEGTVLPKSINDFIKMNNSKEVVDTLANQTRVVIFKVSDKGVDK